jgi:protein gp37
MGQNTGIEWTDATWNPVTGCTRVSSGCDNCYAATLANRLLGDIYRRRLPVVDSPETRADPFAVRLWPERLRDPQAWSAPRRVFVNSMSDLFHRDIPEQFIREAFTAMLDADQHVYQVLTKRPSRATRFLARNADLLITGRLPAHIWLGASVEDARVAYRVDQLGRVPATVRFLSCEPLLGPIEVDLEGIHWVIAGGESGPVRRPMDPDWARSIRDQCVQAGVPFFFKQVGGRTPKAGGRLLDGRTWDEYPSAEESSLAAFARE